VDQHQLIGVDAEITDVVAERTQADLGILVEIALAEFEKAAKRFQHLEIPVDRFAGKRIEDDVHALSAGLLEDLVGKGQGTRVKYVFHTEQAQEVALFVRSGGGIDFGTDPLGDLDGGDSDAARSAMNQHLFFGLQACQVVQGVVDGKEGARDRRRGFTGHAGGNVRNRSGFGHDAVAEA
jgi:hypothetical protein